MKPGRENATCHEPVPATDQERIDRDAEWLLAWFRRNGFPVLLDYGVESTGVHRYFGWPMNTLQWWRSQLTGPPYHSFYGRAWYEIRGLVVWAEQQRAAGKRCRDIGTEPSEDPAAK